MKICTTKSSPTTKVIVLSPTIVMTDHPTRRTEVQYTVSIRYVIFTARTSEPEKSIQITCSAFPAPLWRYLQFLLLRDRGAHPIIDRSDVVLRLIPLRPLRSKVASICCCLRLILAIAHSLAIFSSSSSASHVCARTSVDSSPAFVANAADQN